MFASIEKYLQYIGAALLALITTVTSLLGLTFGGVPEEAATQDTLCLTIAAVSDTHVANAAGAAFLAAGLKDISSAALDVDAALFLGDNTDNGTAENWELFSNAVMRNCAVNDIIVALGNHDTWLSYDTPNEYNDALVNYLTYSNYVMGTKHTTPYYTYEVSGYQFVVLATEGTSVGADMSEKQLAWADAALRDAAAKSAGKPIFVLMHQPLNHTHGVGNNEGGNGFNDENTSEQLAEILNKYENVIYLNGHLHYGLDDGSSTYNFPVGYNTVEKVGDNVTSVNLPCYSYGSYALGGDPLIGSGVIINVYADRVEFLGRNFIMQGWLDDFIVTVPLTGATVQ